MKPCFTGTNHLVSAGLSASSQASGMPVSNLATQHAWQKWRCLAGSGWFAWDNSVAKAHQIFWLKNLNWGAAAEIRVRLSDSGPTVGDLLDTTTTVIFGRITDSGGRRVTSGGGHRILDGSIVTNLSANFDALARQWLLVLDAAISARYGRIDIYGDGVSYLDSGIGHVGPIYLMGRYEDYGARPSQHDLSGIVETQAGVTFVDARGNRRLRDFAVNYIDEDEYFDSLRPVLATAASANIGFVPRPQHARQNQEAIYGLMQADRPVQNSANRLWSFSGQIRERL